jgi:hypothetical protein
MISAAVIAQKLSLRLRISANTSASEAPSMPRCLRIALSCPAQEGIGRQFLADRRRQGRLAVARSCSIFAARAFSAALSGSTVSAKRALESVYSWPQ